MKKNCFVIQRFDGARYDSLYDEVFKPAIEAAGFDAYRVDRDPSASIPIESIEKQICEADACFVELSEDAPNVWFELGYAIARDKPVCLVCSSARSRFPFDIQHRQIIRYPERPIPSDFASLKSRIEARLKSVLSEDIALSQNAEAAKALAVVPSTSGLKPHELLALTVVFQGRVDDIKSRWAVSRDMERSGYTTVAAALALSGLERLGYIENIRAEDSSGEYYQGLAVTSFGEEWLLENQDQLNLTVKPSKTDDDIPF